MAFWAANKASSTTIILLAGDGGYTRPVAALQERGFVVVVIAPSNSMSAKLNAQASEFFYWDHHVCRPAVAAVPLPWQFQPLVVMLAQWRQEGTVCLSRSYVASELVKRHPNVYCNAGVTTWKTYARRAEQAGLIELGNHDLPWVSLRI